MRSVCLDDPLLPLLGYEHRFLSLYSTLDVRSQYQSSTRQV